MQMTEQKWRSPTGHSIASDVTDKLPPKGEVMQDDNCIDRDYFEDWLTGYDNYPHLKYKSFGGNYLHEESSMKWDGFKEGFKCALAQQQTDALARISTSLSRMIETPAPQGWKTIDSAPKDGTEILLALWSGHPEHKTSFCWAINGHYKDGFFYSKDPMIGKLASPTHWQHITAPTPAPTEKVERIEGLFDAVSIEDLPCPNTDAECDNIVKRYQDHEAIYGCAVSETLLEAARAYLKLQSATQED